MKVSKFDCIIVLLDMIGNLRLYFSTFTLINEHDRIDVTKAPTTEYMYYDMGIHEPLDTRGETRCLGEALKYFQPRAEIGELEIQWNNMLCICKYIL